MVMSLSVTMYKRLGISNTDIAFFTSLLYFPWFLKFAWGPFIDMFKTKRSWTVTMQSIIAVTLFATAFALTSSSFLALSLTTLAIMAMASATHDIAADGFYMLSLESQQQAAFVGVRSTFYRLATIFGSGLLIYLAGHFETSMGIQSAWRFVFLITGVLFVGLFAYHAYILPKPKNDFGSMQGKSLSSKQIILMLAGFLVTAGSVFVLYKVISFALALGGIGTVWNTIISTILIVVLLVVLLRTTVASFIDNYERRPEKSEMLEPFIEFLKAFVIFMKKDNIWNILGFLLFFRFAEAQLVKLVQPFLLDSIEKGGLGLSTEQVGITYGTIGIIALTAGGLLGGYAISRKGLKWWLWPMVLIMHTPDLAFVYLSHYQPTNLWLINAAVAFEQFGYGFGFTAYMMYMIMVSQGEHKTAHYAICTGIMALGMMLPGMFSGALQDSIGYKNFFNWVIISTIPGFIVAAMVKIDPLFGKKAVKNEEAEANA